MPNFGLICSKINQCTLNLHYEYTKKVHRALYYCICFLPHLIQFSSLLAYCVGQCDFNSPSDEHSVMDSHTVTFCNWAIGVSSIKFRETFALDLYMHFVALLFLHTQHLLLHHG